MTIPTYFSMEEINNQEWSYNGVMAPLKKKFDGITIELRMTSSTGPFLEFTGLSTKGGWLLMDVDFEVVNEVIHLIMLGNEKAKEELAA